MLRIVIDVVETYKGYYNYSHTTEVLQIICRNTKKRETASMLRRPYRLTKVDGIDIRALEIFCRIKQS